MILTFWRLIYQVSYCGWFLLNISLTIPSFRVNQWKTIHQRKGSCLKNSGHRRILYPENNSVRLWEFADRDLNIIYYPGVSSTMDTAKDLARKNCPDFTVVVAGRQTRGRGRLKRQWLSDDGGLGGIGRIVGPTGGYLIGYLPAVFVKITLIFQQFNTLWRLCPLRTQPIWVPDIPEPLMTRLLWTIGYWLNKCGRIFKPNPAELEPNRFSLPDLVRICMKLLGMLEWVSSAVGIDPPTADCHKEHKNNF